MKLRPKKTQSPITLFCSVVLLLLFCSSSMASVHQQRQLFGKLYSQALAGQEQKVQQQRPMLADYPIDHYLDYALIISKIKTLPEQAIADFKTKHPDSPLNKRLKNALLNALGNQAKWDKYLNHHNGFGQGKKQCWYLNARIQTNQTQGIEPMIQTMWFSGLSAPDACNPAFKWWENQGLITENLYLQRIKLAFETRNISLIEHLKNKLKNRPVWVDQAISLIKNTELSLQQSTQWPPTPETQWLVFKSSMWLAKKKPATLHTFWPQIKGVHKLSSAQVNQVERQTALFAATDYEAFSIDAMNQLSDDMKDDQIKAWIVRYHLFNDDWAQAAHALKQMSDRQLKQARWQYWLARAEAKLGNKKVAQSLFKNLSNQTNYYGFLAADHMKLPYQLCHQNPIAATPNYTAPDAIYRAIELHHTGLLSMARSEWNIGYRGLKKPEKQALANLVQQENWYAKSIAIMADLGQWDNYQLRYPIAHENIIKKHANGTKPMPQWVMAIIKQESAWTKDAVSHANAHGLMQLLPSTANQLAQQLGINISQNNQLHQAPLNIQLGVQYQKNLYQQFDHPLLVAAAYNAGERKSMDWSQDFPMSPDVWLETIPYKETRDYITKILSNVTIYDWLINQQPKRVSYWMPTLPINQNSSQSWPNKIISQQVAPILCSP